MSKKTLEQLVSHNKPSAPEQAVFEAWAEAHRHRDVLARVRRTTGMGLDDGQRRELARIRPGLA